MRIRDDYYWTSQKLELFYTNKYTFLCWIDWSRILWFARYWFKSYNELNMNIKCQKPGRQKPKGNSQRILLRLLRYLTDFVWIYVFLWLNDWFCAANYSSKSLNELNLDAKRTERIVKTKQEFSRLLLNLSRY